MGEGEVIDDENKTTIDAKDLLQILMIRRLDIIMGQPQMTTWKAIDDANDTLIIYFPCLISQIRTCS